MGDRRRGREGRGHRDQGPDPAQRFTPGRIGPKYETSAVLLLAVGPGERLLRRLRTIFGMGTKRHAPGSFVVHLVLGPS
jgi:hypothetical protein